MEDGELARFFYRLLMGELPVLEDFKSYDALGKQPPAHLRDDPDFMRRWQGLSVYDSYRAARNLAEGRRWKRWTHIAILQIPDHASIIYEGPEEYGHWNLYKADPAYLRDHCVVQVVHAESTLEVSSVE